MTLGIEGVVDCRVSGSEALGLALALGLELMRFPFAPSDGRMRVFDRVVVSPPSRIASMPATENFHRSLIRGKAVGHDFVRHGALVFEQFSEQFQRCRHVPSFLDENVEHLTFAVNSPPHERPLATDTAHHFVEMPDAVDFGAGPADVGGDCQAKLVGPAADRLEADVDPTFGE